MAISLEINRPNHILISIAPTKPSKTSICTTKTLFSRDFVPRPCQKGSLTDLFYALHIIRLRIGKFPDKRFFYQRKIEVVASSARKILSSKEVTSPDFRLAIKKICLFLNRPLSSLLDELNISELAPIEIIEHLLYKKLYDMDFCKWRPQEPIYSLIESLRSNGPIICSTTLTNSRLTRSSTLHKIVIVGAELVSKSENHVFYLDPLDGGHTLYETSYEKLCAHSVSIPRARGCIEKALDGESTSWGWQNPI
ncbi:MAG: hypothetical protein FJZ59_05465 [Chlamydiae bacterium]|nr:hypothetical protein [Chlamydiota bacterium]